MALIDTTGLHHVRLTLSDLARSRAFYEEILGFEVAAQSPSTVEERAHAHLVALRVGQDDERRRLCVVDHPATFGDRGRDPPLGDVVRNPQVNVEALTRSLVCVSVLEPEHGHPPTGIDNIVTRE